MRALAWLGVAATLAACTETRHVAPPARPVVAKVAVETPAPPRARYFQYQLSEMGRRRWFAVEPGSEVLGLVEGTRIVDRQGELLAVQSELNPPLLRARAVPAFAGGGFVFWNPNGLYRSTSYLGELELVASLPAPLERIAFGFDRWLLLGVGGFVTALDPRTGQLSNPQPFDLVDMAASADGRMIAAFELGRYAVSLDRGTTFRDVGAELRGNVTRLSDVPLGFVVDERTLFELTPDGKLSSSAAPRSPKVGRPKPKLDEIPLAERALLAGMPLGEGRARLMLGAAVVEIELASSQVLRKTAELLPSVTACELLHRGHDALAMCRTAGSTVFFSQLEQSAPRLEQSFVGSPRVTEAFGRVLVAAACGSTEKPLTVCVRGDGGWKQVSGAAPPGEDAKAPVSAERYALKADGGVVAFVRQLASYVDLSTGRAVNLGPNYPAAVNSEACEVDRQGKLACISKQGPQPGPLAFDAEGAALPRTHHFEKLALAGRRALGIAQKHLFQSDDFGASWVEVLGPPTLGTLKSGVAGCSDLGCVLDGWQRWGWEPTPPSAESTETQPAPAAPRIALAPELPRLTCRVDGQGTTNAVTAADETSQPGFGAELLAPGMQQKPLLATSTRALRDGYLETVGMRGALRTLVEVIDLRDGGRRIVHRQPPELRYFDFLDPFATQRRARFDVLDIAKMRQTLGIDEPYEPETDSDATEVVPVLSADASKSSGFIAQYMGVTSWVHGDKVELLPIGPAYMDWLIQSAVAKPAGELAILLVNLSDGRARVLQIQKHEPHEIFDVPGTALRADHPTPDALALSSQGELAVLRFTGSTAPPSPEAPVLVYAPGRKVTTLAPWGALRTADDDACRAPEKTKDGYRAIVSAPASWFELRSTTTLDAMSHWTTLVARWSESQVCLERVEAAAEPADLAGDSRPTHVVASFTPEPKAIRIGTTLGWEMRQKVTCDLAPP